MKHMRILLLPILALALSSCTFYSLQQGNLGLDGASVKFTVHANWSQVLSNLYFQNCHENFGCYQNAVIAGDDPGDLIGQEALNDCNPNNNGVCGTDEVAAIFNRAFTQPGGYPTGDPSHRCVAFNVSLPPGAAFIYGTWNWYRPGNWNCADS